MDSFELNKIIGAILGTLLFVMGVGFIAEAIYAPTPENGTGYALPEPEGGVTAAAAKEEAPATPLPVLLASADPESGAKITKKCQSCHNFEKGGANKTGPDLYGVVGRPIASHEGFDYSDALKQFAQENGDWSYQLLFNFIHDPRGDVPGTKMTFAGIKGEKDRADVLAYLQTLSDNPVPFPAPEAAPASDAGSAADASAGGDAASGAADGSSQDNASSGDTTGN